MTARLLRRTGATILVAAVAATALTACDRTEGTRLTYDDTEKVKVSEIVVAGNSGDVAVRASAIGETRIRRIVRSDGTDPEVSYRISGTTLTVDTNCGSDCRASYEIEAPTGVAVRGELHSGSLTLIGVSSTDVAVHSGSIDLQGVTGTTKARANSGSITANALRGAATFEVTSGSVEATDLIGGAPIRAEASSGSVDLRLTQPASVTARATSGGIDLEVPAGAYRIQQRTTSGDFDSDVTSVPGAANVLDLEASSGNISVRQS